MLTRLSSVWQLGTHARAKRKVKEMEGAIDKIAQAAKKAAAASTK